MRLSTTDHVAYPETMLVLPRYLGIFPGFLNLRVQLRNLVTIPTALSLRR